MKLDPEALTIALEAHRAHRADPGRKGCGIEKAITAYLTAIGETHVLVPRISTPKMDAAGVVYLRTHPSDASGCYETMLAAAKEGE